jgi:hypothetical protein
MTALSSLLVQNQALSVTQVEQTLLREGILGGDLATNILELGILKENVLAKYMAQVQDIPLLPDKYLKEIEPSVIKKINSELAQKYKIVPVHDDGTAITLAVVGPLLAETLSKLESLLGAKIKTYLVLEVRMSMLLASYYNIDMSARMASLQKKIDPDFFASSEQSDSFIPPEDNSEGDFSDIYSRPTAEPESAYKKPSHAPLASPVIVKSSKKPRSDDSTRSIFTSDGQLAIS